MERFSDFSSLYPYLVSVSTCGDISSAIMLFESSPIGGTKAENHIVL